LIPAILLALREPRKDVVHAFDVPISRPHGELQILFDAQIAKDVPALRHEADPQPGNAIWR
jgi:hypothetical protein